MSQVITYMVCLQLFLLPLGVIFFATFSKRGLICIFIGWYGCALEAKIRSEFGGDDIHMRKHWDFLRCNGYWAMSRHRRFQH